MAENPFFHRGPVKRLEYFFGRTRETGRILQLLKNGQSVSVEGPRKIGKTSLLLHLADPQVCARHGLDPDQYLLIYIDCEMLGGLGKSDIYRIMLEEIGHQAGVKGAGSGLAKDDQTDLRFHPFRRVIRELTRQGLKLIYLLDEFECLGRNRGLNADFFSSLRSLTLHNVAYVTASQDPLLELTLREEVLSSPFFNIFAAHRLGLFPPEEAVQFLNELSQAAGVQFPAGVVDFILALVGLHPFYLQIAGYHAFELATRRGSFDVQGYGQLEERVLSDLANHFTYFLDRLEEEERRALVRLAKAGTNVLPFEIGQKLERQCLVVKENGGYRCLARAVEDFVLQKLATSWDAAIAEGERRLMTVLYADLVDYTSMAEKRRPEEVTCIMKQVTRLFSDPVERHGGVIIQFRGDGVLALFGVPVEQEDDAVRAVRASLDIQRDLWAFGQEMLDKQGVVLSARIGLNTGPVVVAEMGNGQHAEHTAMGDAVNLAERMQRAAQPGGILISEHTYQQVRGLFKVQPLGPIQVKGKTAPVKAYQIVGER